MNNIWLKSYPQGVPAQIDTEHLPTLNELQAGICARFAGKPAFSSLGGTISFAELAEQSAAFAAYLINDLALVRGERVALMMPNLLQYPVALFGVLRAGGVVVNVNPLYTPRELHHQLADSGASVIVVLDQFAHVVQEAMAGTSLRHVIVTRIGDLLHFPRAQLADFTVAHIKHLVPEWHIDLARPFNEALSRGRGRAPKYITVRPEDAAFLQYTGGTTGVPKGAVLTHASVAANVEQTLAWVSHVLKEGEEVAVIPLPMYHIFALTTTLCFFALGARNVLITNPRDLHGFVKEIRNLRFSAMIGVNTLFHALLEAEGSDEIDCSAVKVIVAGGMAVQTSVARRWQERFGMPIIEGYGLTETSPIVCANPLDGHFHTGSVGLPVPSTEVCLLDEEGAEVPPHETGEIAVRGPQVMRGYWNLPAETAGVFTQDGWLRTGDIGTFTEEGYLKILDRKKELINVSGFKVFPNEVENVVAMHPGVLEVAAIPAPDERAGEVVKIVVVRRDASLTEDVLMAHCRANLTSYKVPRYIVFRDEPLPKSNIGKILRRVVRDQENTASPAAGQHTAAAPDAAAAS
ncbi:AMP-binding protein [Noviherbaspirillum galbum]|uniref:Long-chain-fatty-acid--CoA ligase n=1 Tax=Noviherbaspirillum galbum TaxID=2709383 RepID=A0A6B3SQ66_9BURK|nr:AMP-binding protein [Noviherbaspirillum galbum]NEX62903.1 AMP-binding protein [Noviherbaspirillum galbum]